MAVLRSSSLPRVTRRSRIRKPRAPLELQFGWAAGVTPLAWDTYQQAIRILRREGIPFLLGGGFALATFVGRWRDTKDIDFYILPGDRERAAAALRDAGFEDYFDRLPYDRRWIVRNIKNEVIVDLIWAMANQRAQVDETWFQRSMEITMRGENLRLLPIEEFLWCKCYIIQRDHCDWIDLLNVIYMHAESINWTSLLNRLGEDQSLLAGVLSIFSWMCPDKAGQLPRPLWRELGLNPPAPESALRQDRVKLLDSRAWFAALLPCDGKLEV